VTVAASTKPVRLRVAYKSPESLLRELTKSVGRGGVRVEARRRVAAGTKFVFELRCAGVKARVEVSGTVMSVAESAPGRFVLHIRYEPPEDRRALDSIIDSIFHEAQSDLRRSAPRVPVQLRAVEDRPQAPTYRIHDLSVTGVGIDVEGDRLPDHVWVGNAFAMQAKLTKGLVVAHGEVVWAFQGSSEGPLPARFGVRFQPLDPATKQLVSDLVTLRALPTPPWIARLFFGSEAKKLKK
jgi:hypothetical protein